MKMLFALSLMLVAHSGHAVHGLVPLGGPGMCTFINGHKPALDALADRLTTMSIPCFTASPRRYVCRLVPGFGCGFRTQHALPVTLSAPSPGVTLDLTQGFPMTAARAHLFYFHDRLSVGVDGSLVDAKTHVRRGYLREDHDRLYAVLTEPFTQRFTWNEDPSLLRLTPAPERIIRAYSCVPEAAFE